MPIPIKDQKMLWGRAAGRCSMPECRTPLVEDETETDDPALIGENCHIVGESAEGPRGVGPMSLEERNKYANLILCCRNHHRRIDQQPGHYKVEELHRLKAHHEAWVRGTLAAPDPARQRDVEFYAGIIDEIARRADFQFWLNWISSMLSHGQPKIRTAFDNELFELRRWLARRPQMPSLYPELEAAIVNFKIVLDDLQETFRTHSVPWSRGEWLITEKFYQSNDWNEELYRRRSAEYEYHVDLVEDLGCELTRAANLIIKRVRETIAPNFMRDEGDLMIQSGPTMNGWIERAVRYTDNDLARNPVYPGIEEFKALRAQRDFHYGEA